MGRSGREEGGKCKDDARKRGGRKVQGCCKEERRAESARMMQGREEGGKCKDDAKIEAGGRALLRTRQNAIYNHLGQDITKERAEEERGKTLSGEEYAEWNEAHWGVDLFDV